MKAPLSLPDGRTTLLLIDLQEEHRKDPRYLVEGYDHVLKNAARLLGAARNAGMPVLHAAFVRDFAKVPPRPFEPVGQGGAPAFSDPSTDLTAICAEVAPKDGERVLQKNDLSCYCEAAFQQMLDAVQADWLIVCGVWTEACVAATVRDAVARGVHVLLVKDACGSGTQAMHQTGVLHLANRLYGGAVAATDDAILLMQGGQGKIWQVSGAAPLRFRAETIGQVYDAI